MKHITYILILYTIIISLVCAEETGDGEKHKCGGDISCLSDEQCEANDAKKNANKDSQEATNIAQKAAQEAKAAENAQQQAAQQAAHQVKEQLAEKAVEAAKAAEAALAGKETIVQELSQEIQQAEVVENEETEHINSLQNTKQAADKALQDAKAESKILQQLLRIVETNIHEAEQVDAGIQEEITEKQMLVDTAKRRKEGLTSQLGKAKTDLSKTKQAATSANQAANEAKSNVQKSRRRRKRVVFKRNRK